MNTGLMGKIAADAGSAPGPDRARETKVDLGACLNGLDSAELIRTVDQNTNEHCHANRAIAAKDGVPVPDMSWLNLSPLSSCQRRWLSPTSTSSSGSDRRRIRMPSGCGVSHVAQRGPHVPRLDQGEAQGDGSWSVASLANLKREWHHTQLSLGHWGSHRCLARDIVTLLAESSSPTRPSGVPPGPGILPG